MSYVKRLIMKRDESKKNVHSLGNFTIVKNNNEFFISKNKKEYFSYVVTDRKVKETYSENVTGFDYINIITTLRELYKDKLVC